MATVTQWNPFGVSLNVTATGSNIVRKSATQFTVLISASWQTYWSGNQTNFGMLASSGGGSSVINTFGKKASSGSGTFAGTYSISGNGAATKTITVTFKNYNDDTGKSATKSVTFDVAVPAWTSYVIKYSANGGGGAPGNQTKWKDQALTLSSTKPTRTGYAFQGWATSASGSVAYTAGGKYTANAGATLYAVWKANTYPITFNANGGVGGPSKQTKTYGTTLVLSTSIPTRDRYNFVGWSTSSTATTAMYKAGGNYTSNSAATLYAVWELAYVKPSIYNVVVIRCDKNGNPADEGLFGRIEFDWATTEPNPTALIEMVNEGRTTFDLSGTSGHASLIAGGQCDSDKTYSIIITVEDAIDYSRATATLNGMKFPVDILAKGRGVSFGKPAELDNTAEFEFEAKFNSPVYGTVEGLAALPEIPAGAELNDYLEIGSWAIKRNDVAATITCGGVLLGTDDTVPPARAGRLVVSSSTGEGIRSEGWSYLRYKFTPYNSANSVWERDATRNDSNVWTYADWWKSTLTPDASAKVYHKQKVLWSGGYYMTAGHTIDLSEAISKQPNGIVLVFFAYQNGVVANQHVECKYVPKYMVTAHPGIGHEFQFTTSKFGVVGAKYLYIHDTYITGHDDNNASGTANGITYDNAHWVLKYVIGV